MTQNEFFAKLPSIINSTDPEVLEIANHLAELANDRISKASSDKAARNADYAEKAEVILAEMGDEGITAREAAELFEGMSSNKASYILRTMVSDGKLVASEGEKGRKLYKKA